MVVMLRVLGLWPCLLALKKGNKRINGFFRKKYGMRSVTIECASLFWVGIKRSMILISVLFIRLLFSVSPGNFPTCLEVSFYIFTDINSDIGCRLVWFDACYVSSPFQVDISCILITVLTWCKLPRNVFCSMINNNLRSLSLAWKKFLHKNRTILSKPCPPFCFSSSDWW